MVFSKYNIKLHRVNETHLELLRKWRNSDYVNSRMIFNDYITSEMQENWFKTINNDQNYYFIAEFNNQKVGVIHVKDIKDNAGEGGIYLASEEFENSDVVPRMIMAFNDFIFDELKLDYIYSQVKRDNKKAISSSIAQGCIENDQKSSENVISFILKPDNYYNKTKKIRKILNNQ